MSEYRTMAERLTTACLDSGRFEREAKALRMALEEAQECLREALWWTEDEDNTPEEDARMFARWRVAASNTPNNTLHPRGGATAEPRSGESDGST